MRQPSGTSWRATAAPCTPPPTPHWSIPSKSTPRWRTRSRKPAAPRPVFSTRSDPCPAGSRTSPDSASPPDATRPKNRSPNRFPPVAVLDLDVDWGLGHEEDDENIALPCLVAWFVMQWELLVTARSTERIDTGSFSPP